MKTRDVLGIFGASATFAWGMVWFAALTLVYPHIWRSFLWIPVLAVLVAALCGLFWARVGDPRRVTCNKTPWTSFAGIFVLGGIFSGGFLGLVLGALGVPGGLNSPSFPNWSLKAGAGLALTGIVVGALSMLALTPLGLAWIRSCCAPIAQTPCAGRVAGGSALVMLGAGLCAAIVGFLTLGPLLGK